MKLLENKLEQAAVCNNQIQPTGIKFTVLRLPFLIVFIALLSLLTACQKDKKENINIHLALNKKWLTVSQLATPSWTDPSTGKTYTDVFEFAKEVFPCVVDDYIVLYQNGTTSLFRNAVKCFPGQSEILEGGAYVFDKMTDSLKWTVPFEIPGQPTITTTFSSKVLELTKTKFVIRYNQVLPFTETLHTITQTYKAIP